MRQLARDSPSHRAGDKGLVYKEEEKNMSAHSEGERRRSMNGGRLKDRRINRADTSDLRY